MTSPSEYVGSCNGRVVFTLVCKYFLPYRDVACIGICVPLSWFKCRKFSWVSCVLTLCVRVLFPLQRCCWPTCVPVAVPIV